MTTETQIVIRGETSKAYLRRLREGWFDKFAPAHLSGIDIGCQHDPLNHTFRRWDVIFGDGDATLMEGVPDGAFHTVYASHILEHCHDPLMAIGNWWRITEPGGHLIINVPHRDLYEGRTELPSNWNPEHKHFYLPDRDEAPVTRSLQRVIREVIPDPDIVQFRVCKDGWTQPAPGQHAPGEYSIEAIIRKPPIQKSVPFQHFSPATNPHIASVTDERYLLPLTRIMSLLPCRKYLVIGCLCGTTETYLLTHTRWRPDLIAVIDCDSAEYNPERDSGAYAYANICGTRFGAFTGELIYGRVDSKSPTATELAHAFGPFDVVLVDGEHTAEAVSRDMSLAASCLSADGVMLVHDISLEGSTTPLGYRQWIATNPEWQQASIPNESVIHGLGILWRTGKPCPIDRSLIPFTNKPNKSPEVVIVE